jgi:hypothetical protein
MSLHVLANHMAAQGRGPDSALVHMSPRELQSLQSMAQAHGGSLTINPETGLPEAGFLDSILPMAAGFLLGPAGFGLMSAGMAGAAVGGITALTSHDLGKGLMAGLGAYGGAGLGESLLGSGASTVGAEQVAAGQLSAEQIAARQAATETAAGASHGAFMPSSAATAFTETPSNMELLGKGVSAATSSPGAAMKFATENWKPIAAAALPVLSQIDTTTPMATPAAQAPGYIRPYYFNPYTKQAEARAPVLASEFGARSFPTAKEGGLMSLAEGGVTRFAHGDVVDSSYQPALNDQSVAKAANMALDNQPVLVAPAATAAPAPTVATPTYSAQQIQDAIAASRQQGFTNDQILQGAKANFGTDVSQYLTPASAASAAAPAAAPATTSTRSGGMFGNLANISTNLSPDTTAASTSSAETPSVVRAADQSTVPTVTPKGGMFGGVGNVGSIGNNLNAAPAATTNTGGISALNTGTAGTTASNAFDALANTTAATTTGTKTTAAATTPAATTAAATPAVDQQQLAIQAVQSGIAAGKTPAEIAAAVNTQYGKNFTAQNVRDFAYANGLETVKPALTPEQYAAQSTVQEGQFGGLGQLNAQQQQALALAEAKKGIAAGLSDADIAKLVDAKYVKGFTTQNVTDFINANKLRPINQPPNSTLIGNGTGVLTDTGKILPVSTLNDGTQVVVNPTQVATNAVTAPTNLATTNRNTLPVGVSGNETATINPNGTVSMTTGQPNKPAGGYTGIQSLVDAYTKGGGSTGYVPNAPKTMAEFNAKYGNQTGGSKQAYDYLMGNGAYPVMPYTPHGQIAVPYGIQSGFEQPGANSRYTYDKTAGTYAPNPNYVPVSYDKTGAVQYGKSQNQISTALKGMAPADAAKWGVDNGVSPDEVAMALGVPLSTIIDAYTKAQTAKSATTDTSTTVDENGIPVSKHAEGGEIYVGGMAQGGQAQYNLGSYSDGGRLLRGPGDGVSDSIPATIGQHQPARLADGEFVVPARIVSELGNGSTEAGARKLYQMMDRVQKARTKTTGSNRVATDTRADKYLPA